MTNPSQPIIGIVCFTLSEAPGSGVVRCAQNYSYVRSVIGAGGAPVLLPHTDAETVLRSLYDHLDGLLLPGGVDIHPARYGEEVLPACGQIDPGRDELELRLARWALEEGKPLLAVCRGIQVLNVALGGSLYQDIAAQRPEAARHDWYPNYPRDRLSHPVEVAPGTRLAEIVDTSRLEVNSLHHQAVKAVAPGLVVSATAPDGVVEGLEAPGHPFALGVQWHPEELTPAQPHAQALLAAFVHAAASHED